jgi:hypothetical protein
MLWVSLFIKRPKTVNGAALGEFRGIILPKVECSPYVAMLIWSISHEEFFGKVAGNLNFFFIGGFYTLPLMI